MATSLAVDFNRVRVRTVEVDGSLKSPNIKSFAAIDVPRAQPGEDQELVAADAFSDLIRTQKPVRDPSACSLDSYTCTFRELELPFTLDEQIQKVLKFEAESHLHLFDIDDVVVEYRKLTENRNGSHLLVMAYEKATIRQRLMQMQASSVDPQLADLHLFAVFTALTETGYLEKGAHLPVLDDDTEDQAETLPTMVIECDHDVTHLLVVRDGVLVGARAIRLAARAFSEDDELPPGLLPESELGDEDGDEELVVLEMDDDFSLGAAAREEEEEEAPPAPRIVTTKNYFGRLRREIQRTLFPLALTEQPLQVLVLGPVCQEDRFVQRLGDELGYELEVARPFDRVDHSLDPAVLEVANAEGAAALGTAFRLLGSKVNRIDFRQEDVKYAKKFDHLKVPLSCLAIAVFILAFLYCLVSAKEYLIKKRELQTAANSAFGPYLELTADRELRDRFVAGEIESRTAVNEIVKNLETIHSDLSTELGREGGIPVVPSGLDVVNKLVLSLDEAMEKVGRLEINSIELDLMREKPYVKLKGVVDSQGMVDHLVESLRRNEMVEPEGVSLPRTGERDGRTEFSNLTVNLKPEWGVVTGRKIRR